MRMIKTVAAAMLFVSVFAFGMGNTPARAGLRAAWSFEETAGNKVYDRSGNHNIGIIRGDPKGSYAPGIGRADFERRAGQAGQALYLKNGSFIEIPDTDDIRLNGRFTIESWWLATNVSQVLFYKGMCEYWLNRLRPQHHNYSAGISAGKIMFSCTDINGTIHRISAKAPSGGGWHLLDFVYNGKALEIYIDKTLAASREIGAVQIMAEFNQELTIGAQLSAANTVSGALAGGVDEFRIYDEALTPDRMGRPLDKMIEAPSLASERESGVQRMLRYVGLKKELLTVTKDGRAAAAIVIRKGYTELQSVPAKELQRYIEKLTGARLPILEDDPGYNGNMILVGESRYTRELGITTGKLPGDSYVMRSFPGRLVLAGHDDVLDVSNPEYEIPEEVSGYYKRGLKIVKNGTLNAVYAFLQDYCGVRWFMPGDLGEHVPARHDLDVSGLNITDQPYRSYMINSSIFRLRYQSWLNRNFIGESAAAFVFDIEHDWEVLVPYRRWFAAHPEWFAMNKDGVREPRPLCTSNRAMWDVALKNLKLIYAQGFEIVGLLQPDGYQRCQCPDCEAMDEFRGYPYVLGKPIERVWIFHDYLAREIQKAYPDRQVMIWGSPEPSHKISKLSDNVRIMLQVDATDTAQLERWKKHRPSPPPYSAFVYWFLPEVKNNLPHSYDYIAGELKVLAAHGTDGFYVDWCGGLWGLNGPIYYMMTRVLRDPRQDPKAILQEYCGGLFGKAAGPMHAYFTELYRGAQQGRAADDAEQRKYNERVGRGEPVYRGYAARDLYLISYPDEILEACEGNLQKAQSLADTPKIKKRVEFFADAFGYIKLTARGFQRLKECETAAWSKESMQKLIRAVAERNKFVEDRYARWSNDLPVSFYGSLDGVLYGVGGGLAMPFKVLKEWNAAELYSDDKSQVALSLSGVGSEGILSALKKAQYKVFPLLSPVINDPIQYPVVIIPQQTEAGVSLFNQQVSQLRDYVMKGGAIMLTHDAVGLRQFKAAFPEIGKGVGPNGATNRVIIATNHVITAGMNAGDSLAHAYFDHIVLEKGPQGTVICTDTTGRPVMVAGTFGQGKVILNGMIPGYASQLPGSYAGVEKEPEGGELKILLNAVNWLQAK